MLSTVYSNASDCSLSTSSSIRDTTSSTSVSAGSEYRKMLQMTGAQMIASQKAAGIIKEPIVAQEANDTMISYTECISRQASKTTTAQKWLEPEMPEIKPRVRGMSIQNRDMWQPAVQMLGRSSSREQSDDFPSQAESEWRWRGDNGAEPYGLMFSALTQLLRPGQQRSTKTQRSWFIIRLKRSCKKYLIII